MTFRPPSVGRLSTQYTWSVDSMICPSLIDFATILSEVRGETHEPHGATLGCVMPMMNLDRNHGIGLSRELQALYERWKREGVF